jgi:microcystin-dependent protein
MAWPTATAPAGYLECDGAAVSRTTYARLFAVIAETYGNGNGTTTFNLPDLRGEFIRGWDNSAGTDPDAASRTDRGDATTGDNVGTKQASAFALHGHPYRTSTGTTPKANVLGGLSTDEDGTTANQAAFTGTPSDSAGEQIGGSGASTETRPTNVGMMWIIKT